MDQPLPQGWRIDELEREGLRIIQDPNSFCFGMDAVLLAHFARAKASDRVLDLGSGQGVLPLLLYGLYKPKLTIGIEIQPQFAQMAMQSVQLNALDKSIRIVCGDYRDLPLLSSLGPFHLVVSNPPYHPVGSGELRRGESDSIARFELTSTLFDVVQAASSALLKGGRFCMVHLPRRLPEVILAMEEQKLTIKRLLFVHPNVNKPASLLLVEGVKHAKKGLTVLTPLFVHDADGRFTKAMQDIYDGGTPL